MDRKASRAALPAFFCGGVAHHREFLGPSQFLDARQLRLCGFQRRPQVLADVVLAVVCETEAGPM